MPSTPRGAEPLNGCKSQLDASSRHTDGWEQSGQDKSGGGFVSQPGPWVTRLDNGWLMMLAYAEMRWMSLQKSCSEVKRNILNTVIVKSVPCARPAQGQKVFFSRNKSSTHQRRSFLNHQIHLHIWVIERRADNSAPSGRVRDEVNRQVGSHF